MGMTGIFAMSMIGSRLQDCLFPYVCVSGCLQISVRSCLFCFYSCLPTHFYLSLPHSLYSPLTPLLSLPLSVPPPHSLSHSPSLPYSFSLSFSLSHSTPSPFQPPPPPTPPPPQWTPSRSPLLVSHSISPIKHPYHDPQHYWPRLPFSLSSRARSKVAGKADAA